MNTIGRTILTIGALMTCLLMAHPSSASPYSGAWDVTTGNMYALQISFAPSTSSMYLYDFGNTANRMLVVNDQLLSYSMVYFTKSTTGVWYASTSYGGHDLTLGSTPDFGFLFLNGSTVDESYDLTVTRNMYDLKSSDMNVLVAGAMPNPNAQIDPVSNGNVNSVPEPKTLLLLGIGLTVFAFIGIRKKNHI